MKCISQYILVIFFRSLASCLWSVAQQNDWIYTTVVAIINAYHYFLSMLHSSPVLKRRYLSLCCTSFRYIDDSDFCCVTCFHWVLLRAELRNAAKPSFYLLSLGYFSNYSSIWIWNADAISKIFYITISSYVLCFNVFIFAQNSVKNILPAEVEYNVFVNYELTLNAYKWINFFVWYNTSKIKIDLCIM